MTPPPATTRDPVCDAIDAFLEELQTASDERLEKRDAGDRVTLRFAEVEVDAPSYDRALLRLAAEMIDRPKYQRQIMQLLREPLRKSRPDGDRA